MTYREHDLLRDPEKRVREARGVLTAIWRQFLNLRDIDGFQWDRLMRNYLDDPRNGVRQNPRDRSTERGNTNKELLKSDNLTWGRFLKGMFFLEPVKLEFTVRASFKDGKTHQVTAKLKDRNRIRLTMSGDPAASPVSKPDYDEVDENYEDDEEQSDLDQVEDLDSLEERRFLGELR